MFNKLKPGWYIILYHDINWEENLYNKFIGGTCPPDIFYDHVSLLNNLGEFVSINEGLRLISDNRISRPVFSLWFDDGLKGVFNYALPITEEFNVKPAISICSDFLNRKEMFWRYKLSFLHGINFDGEVRKKLKMYGYKLPSLIKDYTVEHFTPSLVNEIDEIYNAATTEIFREDSFRSFINKDDLLIMKDKGWTIANHTTSHYRLSKHYTSEMLIKSFEECESNCPLLKNSNFWVLPFGYPKSKEKLNLQSNFAEKYFVFVNNKINTHLNYNEKSLNRIDTVIDGSNSLKKKLLSL